MDLIFETIYNSSLLKFVAILMLLLSSIDMATFFSSRIEHLDCKGLLTGIGLLGTFWGIFMGLMDFDAYNIKASVPILLDGLKFAFLSSILGMLLATALHLIQMGFKAVWDLDQVKTSQPSEDRLITIAQNIETNLTQGFQDLTTYLQKQDTQLQQQLDNLQQGLHNIYWVLYENRSRFLKIGTQGEELSANAPEWAAIYDNDSNLYWEHKAKTGTKDAKLTLNWSDDIKAYQQSLNSIQLAGFSDWRLPTPDELNSIFNPIKGIDQRFFGTLEDPTNRYPFIFSNQQAPDKPNKGIAISKHDQKSKPSTKAYVLLVRGGH